jgi:serine/threonine protein kinase
MIRLSRLWKGTAALPAPDASPVATAAQSAFRATAGVPAALSNGSLIGRCLLLRQLGEGAIGRVFHAHHKTLNISVAVKLIRAELFSDPRVHEQLQHEAQLLARLNHPHVVRVLDFEDDPACPYIVLEFIEGPTLAELIEQCGRLAPDRAVRLMRQVARGLNAAWKLGIIHRDLKPANILLTRAGDAKLSDLGLAVVLGTPPDPSQPAAAGTPLYAAPEQCFAPEKVDQRTDLYALGATFYHALTGVPPFMGASMSEVMRRHANESPTPPHHQVPGIPGGLSAVILRLLAKDPGHRYADYEQLLHVLDNQIDGPNGERSRARMTVVAPAANLEEVLRTEQYLGAEARAQMDAGALAAVPGRHDKDTATTRRFVAPSEEAAPPRSPSQIPEQMLETRPDTSTESRPEVKKVASGLQMPAAAEAPPVDSRLAEAIAASSAGRPAEAVALLRDLTRDDPANDAAWLWLARLVGAGAEAVSIYQRVLEKNPENVTARQGLLSARLAAANADARAGNRDSAREAFRQLTAQFPDLEEARVGLARLAETPAEAEQLWREVLRINPGRPEARLAVGRRGRR